MAVNYAKKYAAALDERFEKESQAGLGLSGDYEFKGVQTVAVYSIPTVPLTDYSRSGTNRYGTPTNLGNSVQEMTLGQDKAFSMVIDRGDRDQTAMTMNAGQALSREIRERVIPEYDSHVFRTLAKNAGNTSATGATKDNAYSLFLAGQEALGDASVPDTGRVCFCSYAFSNLLKQSPSFIRYGDASQRMLQQGIIGTVDGVKIVNVPKSRLPSAGTMTKTYASFILTHPSCACGPKQLEKYIIHDDPPGISGWLIEGRTIFDCFVYSQKADGIYYQGPTLS